MTKAVIVSTARTPLAKSWKGAFNMTHGATLGGHVVRAALQRAGVSADAVEDVIMGCANPEGATGMNIARQIALMADCPITVSGMTVNRFCSSGLQTIALASQRILAGEGDVFVAGGVESISCVQQEMNQHMLKDPALEAKKPEIYWSMLQTAEQVAKRYGIEAVNSLEGEVTLRRESDGMTIAASGHFKAEVTQACVTTLEPVPDEIAETFEGWFLDESQATSFTRARKKKLEVDVGDVPLEDDESPIVEERDEPDPVVNGNVEIGGFRAQPYEQLAAYYRSLGNDGEAGTVLLAKQRAQRAVLPWARRIPGHLLDLLVGYGYRPLRAIGWAVCLLAASSAYFATVRPQRVNAEDTSVFNPVLYSADHLIPVIRFGQSEVWQYHGVPAVVTVVLTVLGWTLGIAIAAAATRTLTRN